MKNKKIEFIKAISDITVTKIFKDSDRGNMYRGLISEKKLDDYIEEIDKHIKSAYENLLKEND